MKTQENGKTTEVSRRRKERVSEPQRERLGFVSVQSQIDGIEQIRTGSEDRQRGNTTRSGKQGREHLVRFYGVRSRLQLPG